MADKIAKRGVAIFLDKQEVENSVKAINIELGKLIGQQKQMIIGSDEYIAHAKKIGQLQSALKEHRENVKKINSEYENGKEKSQSYFSKLKNSLNDLPGPAGVAISAVKGFGVALKALMLNPVGAVIAAVVGALMLLHKAFMSTDTGATLFAGALKAMGNVMDVVLDRVISFTKLIGSIAKMDFEGMKKNYKDAFGGAAEAIRDAAAAGFEYANIMDDIEDRESASLIRTSRLRSEIEKLKNTAKDQTKSIKERFNANELAMKKEIELNKIEKKFAQERLNAELNNLATKINVQGMTDKQKREQLLQWLKLDDLTINSFKNSNERFRKFADENEDDFKALQKLKSELYDIDANFEQGTRRLQSENSKFRKELINDEVNKRKEAQKKKEEIIQKEIEAVDTASKVEQTIIQELYRTNQINEIMFQQMSEANVLYSLERKRDLLLKYGKSTVNIDAEISNQRLKIQETDLKQMENFRKAMADVQKLNISTETEDSPLSTETYTLSLRLKILEAFHKKGLRSEEQYQKELAELLKGNQSEINKYLTDQSLKDNQENYDKGLIGTKQYLDNQHKIVQSYWEEKFAKANNIAESISKVANAAANVVSQIAEAETLAVDNKYAAQLKAAKKAGKDTTAIEEKIESEKLAIRKKYADLEFGIKAASIIADTAMAVMKMWAEGGVLGPVLAVLAGAAGVTQLAVANQQRQEVKNLWTGGFTGPGGKFDPKGIVHSNEFVSNSDALRNKNIMPLFNMIDEAQKSGTVQSLTKKDLVRALSPSYSDYNISMPGRNTGINATSDASIQNDAIMSVLSRNIETIERLNKQLDEGIESYSVISGKNGSFEQTRKYERLIKNVSR